MSNINNFFDINDNIIKNDNNYSYVYHLLMIISTLYINYYILTLLINLNKCKCANIDESLYLKEWFVFSIISQIIIIIIYFISNNNKILLFISIIIIILGLIMIIRFLIYNHKLQQIKCHCNKMVELNKYIIYSYIIIIIIAFILLIINK
jgi:hypothetical protein